MPTILTNLKVPPSLPSLQKKAKPKEVILILFLIRFNSTNCRFQVVCVDLCSSDDDWSNKQSLWRTRSASKIPTNITRGFGTVTVGFWILQSWMIATVTSKERMVAICWDKPNCSGDTLSCANCWKYNWPIYEVCLHLHVKWRVWLLIFVSRIWSSILGKKFPSTSGSPVV